MVCQHFEEVVSWGARSIMSQRCLLASKQMLFLGPGCLGERGCLDHVVVCFGVGFWFLDDNIGKKVVYPDNMHSYAKQQRATDLELFLRLLLWK